jgi:hypothetical protein
MTGRGRASLPLRLAARRWPGWFFWLSPRGIHLDLRRREGRLFAFLGDTVGAIEAYNRYLSIRRDPDPPWREEWEQVRSELAALVGEPQGS